MPADRQAFRRWYSIHKWTSLVCTGFLLLLCLTGLPLIFHDELGEWLSGLAEPPAVPDPTAQASLQAIVGDAQARRPAETIQFLTREEDRPAWLVTFGAKPDSVEASAIYRYDSRNGAFLHEIQLRNGLLFVLLTLHVELFAGLPGTLFLGVMGLLFLWSVLSGVVVYGPFMRKLPFGTVRRERSPRLTGLDLHNLLGIVTVLWALVVGGTGVINTLAWPLLSYWQATELAEMTAPWNVEPAPLPARTVDEIVATAEATEHAMTTSVIAFPGTPFAGPHHHTIFMRGQTPLTARLLKPLLIETATAEVSAARELPWYLTGLLLSQPLHFGDYGGLPLKLIWALLDLITIGVLISGLYLWWKKRHMPVEQLLKEAEPGNGMALPTL